MINLTDKDIAEFQILYKKETGKEISKEQARMYAMNVVQLATFVLSKPGTEEIRVPGQGQSQFLARPGTPALLPETLARGTGADVRSTGFAPSHSYHLPKFLMTNVNRGLLESKKSERVSLVKRHEGELHDIDRDIAALEVAAKIEESASALQTRIEKKQKIIPRDAIYKERRHIITSLLPKNGTDLYHKEIASALKMHSESLKDWMQTQMRLQNNCPWTNGRNKSYFRLTDSYRALSSLEHSSR